ncbi:MAG: methylenetetrahydrofolate--tRNA-(uracil(54)-C(5))-methyltransferase (FADH(2)-oxidizing) TrmFO [Oligoflexia bacterium]|nr:methylenetetrahydrofolate--tRNA-(uracil(54)-C(5))-methyltransferase (FADH(2)-oxidizing) TrmFO [Oligoflexia bacterium]
MSIKKIRIIGAGLAGTEAAYWLANRGINVDLYEMRPNKQTEAHQTKDFAELVCSNSFKSLNPISAPGILKREMKELGSLSIASAEKAAVAAGEALAVDRDLFSKFITEKIYNHPLINIRREEVLSLPDDNILTILATGPLTSESLSLSLSKHTGSEHFYFYDAISPIVDLSSVNFEKAFYGNRYGKTSRMPQNSELEASTEDYINCPLDKNEYDLFINELLAGQRVEPKQFERVKHFEGCMPIEEMADRGFNTLRFGPMKPVGLPDPKTGKEAYAIVQLRPENLSKTSYNLVGFQTKLKYGEQTRIFRLIPGLENAEFIRLGSMHRNTFVDSPRVLSLDLRLKKFKNIMLAGQITGVEGYMESASTGLIAGIYAHAILENRPIPAPPANTAFGALLGHIQSTHKTDFQPSGINFSLFEDHHFTAEIEELRTKFRKKIPKEEKRKLISQSSERSFMEYCTRLQQLAPTTA